MTLGERIKDLRKEKEITQAQFAEILNVDRSAIAKYESNKNFPSIPLLIEIALFFKVTTDYLLGLDELK